MIDFWFLTNDNYAQKSNKHLLNVYNLTIKGKCIYITIGTIALKFQLLEKIINLNFKGERYNKKNVNISTPRPYKVRKIG